ncbi:hypothetical protein Fmac_027945 [Flemingia macrophylla]|uniref:Bifunctional inhibitor/plant lipid transfer protein/seed storage helical domain-containing protein n=1 Tax=Flemingia macrophylla TaxID=520843 RepID=A0ABD1LJB0_9FABA
MKRVKIFNLITVSLTFLAFVPNMESQLMPPSLHPLCLSQLALVNFACAMLPLRATPPTLPRTPSPSPFPPLPLTPSPSHATPLPLTPSPSHATPLPLTPSPSPSPPDADEGHRSHQTSQEDDCCRWAREIDSQCVCEILVLLPPFLSRPLHQYSISIGESCNVTYTCGGPI